MAITPPVLATSTYDDLLKRARQRAFEASNGLLNDTSEASVLTALFKQQAQALIDQNNLLNTLPSLAVEYLLQAMGAGLSGGVPSLVRVTVVLNQISGSDVIIPRFKVSRSGIAFMIVDRLEVPAGTGTIQTLANALVIGTAGNVSPGQGLVLEPQPLVQSVIFEEIVLEGKEPESLATVGSTTLAERLSSGSLTRISDFEREVRSILGRGSVALAIGKLGADKQTREPGAMHLFGLNPDGTELSSTQIQNIQLTIEQFSPLATIYTSTMQVKKLQASAIVVLEQNADGVIVSNAIWEAFRDYVQPQKLAAGEPVYVNQLVVLAGKVEGINRVQSVSMGDIEGVLEPGNQLLPNKWTVPRLDRLVVQCVFGDNVNAYTYNRSV